MLIYIKTFNFTNRLYSIIDFTYCYISILSRRPKLSFIIFSLTPFYLLCCCMRQRHAFKIIPNLRLALESILNTTLIDSRSCSTLPIMFIASWLAFSFNHPLYSAYTVSMNIFINSLYIAEYDHVCFTVVASTETSILFFISLIALPCRLSSRLLYDHTQSQHIDTI